MRRLIALSIRLLWLLGACVWGRILYNCLSMLLKANTTSRTAGALYCVFCSGTMFIALFGCVKPMNELATHVASRAKH
jgi:hypothetical protein